jgi:hypothetical protein
MSEEAYPRPSQKVFEKGVYECEQFHLGFIITLQKIALLTKGAPFAIETMELTPTPFNDGSPHHTPHDKNRSDRQARS